MFKYTLQQDQSIKIETNTNHPVLIGAFSRVDDGYYGFWPILGAGYWSHEMIKQLNDELCKLNAAWDVEVDKINSGTM